MKSFKKWYEEIKSYDILNNKYFREWMFDCFLEKSIWEQCLLLGKNVDAFKNIFGRQTSVFTGEFRYYVWRREFKGYTFLIFSSNKGTSFEIITDLKNYNDEKEGVVSIEFVKSLVDKLEEYYKPIGK